MSRKNTEIRFWCSKIDANVSNRKRWAFIFDVIWSQLKVSQKANGKPLRKTSLDWRSRVCTTVRYPVSAWGSRDCVFFVDSQTVSWAQAMPKFDDSSSKKSFDIELPIVTPPPPPYLQVGVSKYVGTLSQADLARLKNCIQSDKTDSYWIYPFGTVCTGYAEQNVRQSAKNVLKNNRKNVKNS